MQCSVVKHRTRTQRNYYSGNGRTESQRRQSDLPAWRLCSKTWAFELPIDVRRTRQFKRDVKLAQKRGLDLAKLEVLIKLLTQENKLPSQYKDHPLSGQLKGYRDAHITSDWLLLYQIKGKKLELLRTGSHSDIFT